MYFYATPITAPTFLEFNSKGRPVERGVHNLEDWIREVRVYFSAHGATTCPDGCRSFGSQSFSSRLSFFKFF